MLKDFHEYEAIKKNITKIISQSGYKYQYVAKKIGLSLQNFAEKKQLGTWSVNEIKKIVKVITEPNEDAMDALMIEIMRSRKNDEKLTYDEYKAEIGLK